MRARTCLNRHVLIGWTKFSGQTRRPILIGEPNAHQTIAPEELGKVRSLAQSNEIAVSPKRRQRPAPAPTRVRRRQPRSRDPESRARTPTNPLRRCDVHETRTCPVTPGQLRLTQPDPEAVGVLQTPQRAQGCCLAGGTPSDVGRSIWLASLPLIFRSQGIPCGSIAIKSASTIKPSRDLPFAVSHTGRRVSDHCRWPDPSAMAA